MVLSERQVLFVPHSPQLDKEQIPHDINDSIIIKIIPHIKEYVPHNIITSRTPNYNMPHQTCVFYRFNVLHSLYNVRLSIKFFVDIKEYSLYLCRDNMLYRDHGGSVLLADIGCFLAKRFKRPNSSHDCIGLA